MRYALLVSILIHAGLALPFLNARIPESIIKKEKPVVVDYVKLKEPSPVPKAAETPKVDMAAKVEVKPAEEVPVAKADQNAPKEAPMNDAKKQAKIKSTKDYINYYQLIREKIRKRLKSNYRSYFEEGEVALVFTLLKDGKLTGISINDPTSSPDTKLRNIATASVKEASPFPPFPKALSLPDMTFDLTVTFKRK